MAVREPTKSAVSVFAVGFLALQMGSKPPKATAEAPRISRALNVVRLCAETETQGDIIPHW